MLAITDLKQDVKHLNFELEGMTKYVRMLNYKADKLDEIWSMSKPAKYTKEIFQLLCYFWCCC